MAKQQTLTIVVADGMADPAELVQKALWRLLRNGAFLPDEGDDPAHIDNYDDGYMIIEEN